MSNIVNCPCCEKELYRRTSDGGVNRLVKGSAAPNHDQNGSYMVCPHCSCRVILKAGSGPSEFDLADTQTCIRISS